MRRLILRSFQSPGDVLMLTAAVRDLHAACPGQYETDVRSSASALWDHNPHLTPLREGAAGVAQIPMHYPLVHQSNQRPYHFLHGYVQYLEQQLAVRIPVTRFQGDIYLSPEEKTAPPPGRDRGVPERFWILIAGGKYDFTAKWWNPASYQAVVDHFRGRIQFVQCGEAGHWHPKLKGVVDLIGQTATRDFIRLMHHADGVVCPVTFAMHLAAAVESKPGGPQRRPCVVVAGGREPPHWEAYPHHQFISTVGALPCCSGGGCWKSRCQLVGDGDAKDRVDVCERPVQVSGELRIPQCMHLITPQDVIRRIELYDAACGGPARGAGETPPGDAVPARPQIAAGHSHGNGHRVMEPATPVAATAPANPPPPVAACRTAASARTVLIEFSHGLGDAVQLTMVLEHLRHERPDWNIDVRALIGKHSAFTGLCRNVGILDRDPPQRNGCAQTLRLEWPECRAGYADSPSTKAARCLREVFQITPRAEWCRYSIRASEPATAAARRYLAEICSADAPAEADDRRGKFPAVLIHYEGNTSSAQKNLSHELIGEVCDVVRRCGFVPVILDWDRRSPLIGQPGVFHPGPDHELWGQTGTGDAATLAALIEASALMIGVDSGPLHVAGATTTPTIGVWTRHHPVHFYDLADNVLHLVPPAHEKLVAHADAVAYFEKHYRFRPYRQLAVELPAVVESHLTGEDLDQLANKRFLKELSATAYGADYYHEHQRSGLDYLVCGDWQQQYGRWLVESLQLQGRRTLDVGCACGAILRGLRAAGAVGHGVDVNEYMIQLGRNRWPDMAADLYVCDAVNLHLFENDQFDALHSSQVAEHWKPDLVPYILRELRRVTVPGGLFFCALDTEELFARQGRALETEDPTHVCIQPVSWWHERLAAAGWQVCTAEFAPRLREHAESFLSRYDWDWFVARRSP